MLKLTNATKVYEIKNQTINALDCLDIEFNYSDGGFYAIQGHSGSGKTTLIQIIGLLDRLNSGQYMIDNINTEDLNENKKAEFRMNKFGFVFQSFYLNPYLTAVENVVEPMYINKSISKENRKKRAIELLATVNLANRVYHFPRELSGGEQQRVAIARAMANDPDILICDEPTGNLDYENEKLILNLLKEISITKCVIVVTHNKNIEKYADYLYEMIQGKIRCNNEII